MSSRRQGTCIPAQALQCKGDSGKSEGQGGGGDLREDTAVLSRHRNVDGSGKHAEASNVFRCLSSRQSHGVA